MSDTNDDLDHRVQEASSAVPEDGAEVTVAYRPEHDGAPDPGEVVWTWVPYEDDPSQGKDRPVVVIGTAGSDIVVVPLSSRSHARRSDSEEWIEIGSGSWDPAGRVSFANVDRFLRVSPSEVRREGSAIDRNRFDRIVAAAHERHPDLQIGSTNPPP